MELLIADSQQQQCRLNCADRSERGRRKPFENYLKFKTEASIYFLLFFQPNENFLNMASS
jgi:hypothetical protein